MMAEMTQQDVLIGFVLDGSARMGPVVGDSAAGFNTFVRSQRLQPGQALLGLTPLNNDLGVRYVRTTQGSTGRSRSSCSAAR